MMMLFSTLASAATGSDDVGLDLLKQLQDSVSRWTSEGIAKFLWDLIIAILIVVVGKLCIVFVRKVFKRIFARSKKINELMAKFLLKVISGLGWIVVGLVLLDHMGINLAPVLAGLGVTSVILGFAFQESIGNLLSGVMIVINAPFRIGDYVDVGSLSGTVSNMDLMCVTLSTPDNKRITLSNKLVWSNAIVNYSYTVNRRVDMIVSVAYGSDLALVKTLIRNLLTSYPEVLEDPSPIVEVNTLSNSSIDVLARPWVVPENYWKIYWRFQGEISQVLANAGIQIPFPQLDVHLYDIDSVNGPVKVRNADAVQTKMHVAQDGSLSKA